MPSAPKPFRPAKPFRRARPAGTTTERGYGHAHQVARKALLRREPVCQRCRDAFSTDMHHADRDPFNRRPENLVALCERCHHAGEHGRS